MASSTKASVQLQYLAEIELDALLPDGLPDLLGMSADEFESEHQCLLG